MVQTRQVSVQDGKFTVHTFVEGSGPPLLFLHGIDGLPDWPAWLGFLTDRFQVFAPQMPGVGRSTGLEHLDDFQDLALFYLDLLDALGLEKAVLMGHDLGGNIAAEVAAHCRHQVDKLVLLAPTGLWLDETPTPDWFATNRQTLLRYTWHDPEDARQRGLYQEPPTEGEEARQYLLERNKTLTAAGKFLWPIPDKGLKKRLHRIVSPTLIVWGASDGFVPTAYARAFQERIVGSKLVMIEEAAHMPMLEQPERFQRAVLDFLAP